MKIYTMLFSAVNRQVLMNLIILYLIVVLVLVSGAF